MNELKQLRDKWIQKARRIAPLSLTMQTKADGLNECADELDDIIRKHEARKAMNEAETATNGETP